MLGDSGSLPRVFAIKPTWQLVMSLSILRRADSFGTEASFFHGGAGLRIPPSLATPGVSRSRDPAVSLRGKIVPVCWQHFLNPILEE
jgi:hypothetical protein